MRKEFHCEPLEDDLISHFTLEPTFATAAFDNKAKVWSYHSALKSVWMDKDF